MQSGQSAMCSKQKTYLLLLTGCFNRSCELIAKRNQNFIIRFGMVFCDSSSVTSTHINIYQHTSTYINIDQHIPVASWLFRIHINYSSPIRA